MIAWLYLFWYDDRYGLAWHESNAVLGANRFLTVSKDGVPRGESVLLSDPDTYAQGFFVNGVYNGYTAIWGEFGISNPFEESLLVARLDRDGNVIGELIALEDAPISEVAFNGYEHGVLLAHYTNMDSRVTSSYGFTTLSEEGDWRSEEIPLIPAESYARPLLFNWHDTGFGLFYTQREGEETQLAYQEIRCLR